MITNPNVKINLGLNILRKREDGFHDLETLFVPYFDISDTLEIVVGDDYSRTSAFLFTKYGKLTPAKGEGVFGREIEDNDAPKIVQGISDDGKLMITIARAEGVDWDPLKDLTAKAYNILLSDDAKVDTKPQLEIYADDVKCSHGATIGRLNEEEQFYMRSRGITLEDAKVLQMISFIAPVLDNIPDPGQREAIGEQFESEIRNIIHKV